MRRETSETYNFNDFIPTSSAHPDISLLNLTSLSSEESTISFDKNKWNWNDLNFLNISFTPDTKSDYN